MGDLNTVQFNSTQFNTTQFTATGFGPSPVLTGAPGAGAASPYSYPPVIIVSPTTAPVSVVTNIAALISNNDVGVILFKNSSRLTQGTDFTRTGTAVTLTIPPLATDAITAAFYAIATATEQSLAPWSILLSGSYNGVATAYQIPTGAAIVGTIDGKNNAFTWASALKRVQAYRNRNELIVGIDYTPSQTGLLFLSAVPQPGDIVTVFGW